jgi:hypothetical protein
VCDLSCSLKEDLLHEIKKLARKGAYEYLIIEGSGVAEPLPVAEGISTFDIGRGKVLTDIGSLPPPPTPGKSSLCASTTLIVIVAMQCGWTRW